jgi:NAD-dependent deacetylase
MSDPSPVPPPAGDTEALAAILLGAERTLLLSGNDLVDPGRSRADRGEWADWAERASLEAFLVDPGRFWQFVLPLAEEISARQVAPVHRAIARLEVAGLIWGHVTQGVDRLHHRAGSPDPVEVYGRLVTAVCTRCGERYGLPEVRAMVDAAADGVPRCTTAGCGYPLRPEGTLWNEPLPAHALTRAWALAGEADLLVVLDSDLRTAPVSLLPSVPLTRGAGLVVIGPNPTQYDRYARLVLHAPSGPVVTALADLLVPAAGAE